MEYNRFYINAQGRNKYGDYRKPVNIVKQTSGCSDSSYTFTLTNLVANYSQGTALQPDQSNYIRITGTYNTYYRGSLRQSQTGVTVTPIGVENAFWIVENNTILWNKDEFGSTVTPGSMQGVRVVYNNTTSSTVVNINIAANRTAVTSSEILSFSVNPSSITSAATSMLATGMVRRQITFTSGEERSWVDTYIGDESEGHLFVTPVSTDWLSVISNTIYAQRNDTASQRTGTVILKDALYPSAVGMTKYITQEKGVPVWQECYIHFTYGNVTAPSTQVWEEYGVYYSFDGSEDPVDYGDPVITLTCGESLVGGAQWNPINASSGYTYTPPFEMREPYYEVYLDEATFKGKTIYLQAGFFANDDKSLSSIVTVIVPEVGGRIDVTIPQF